MHHKQAAVVPASHLDLLAAPALAHVATIGPDGNPQSNPVWFDWDGAQVRLALEPNSQKLRNLRRNRHLAISIVDPANPGRYLEIRGMVNDNEPDPNRETLKRIVRKYTGSDDLSWVNGERIIVAIDPAHTSQMG